MTRTYVVTGAGSGIGAATTSHLRARGDTVIACDLRDGDVVGDLSTIEGRAALIDGVARLSGGTIDGVVANAGGGPPETMLALNFFGAVATLDGLRPLLEKSSAPRAVAVSSVSSLAPGIADVVDACLSMDERQAIEAGRKAIDENNASELYGCAKRALNRWCRRKAVTAGWAGAGILLNVVAPGFVDTPAAQYILANPELREQMSRLVPLRAAMPGRASEMAAMIAWCVGAENALLTGQVLFVDGGLEALARGEQFW
jgi:NAD(P)-dependent dehydrogenase (short-subunit alcohol dehydrogenase family)